MSKIISIGQAAKLLGVHVQTMRNWEKSGKLKPDSIYLVVQDDITLIGL